MIPPAITNTFKTARQSTCRKDAAVADHLQNAEPSSMTIQGTNTFVKIPSKTCTGSLIKCLIFIRMLKKTKVKTKMMKKAFVQAAIKLIDRILGTTKRNIAGMTRMKVSLHVESLTGLFFVFIMRKTSAEANEKVKRLVTMVNSWTGETYPSCSTTANCKIACRQSQ